MHRAEQWVADEFYGNPGIAVELFFKRKNAEGFREAPADYTHAPGAPGPELRADVIGVFYAAAFEFSGEAEMEAGEVGEDVDAGGAHLRATHAENFELSALL